MRRYMQVHASAPNHAAFILFRAAWLALSAGHMVAGFLPCCAQGMAGTLQGLPADGRTTLDVVPWIVHAGMCCQLTWHGTKLLQPCHTMPAAVCMLPAYACEAQNKCIARCLQAPCACLPRRPHSSQAPQQHPVHWHGAQHRLQLVWSKRQHMCGCGTWFHRSTRASPRITWCTPGQGTVWIC